MLSKKPTEDKENLSAVTKPHKPYRGRIMDWCKVHVSPMDWFISGTALDHPQFQGQPILTSFGMTHDETSGKLETRNAFYQLVGPGKET